MSEKTNQEETNQEMQEEYDFSNGVRGKYADRIAKGSHVIVLEPDVAEVFPDSESVNRVLRTLIPVINEQAEKVPH